MPPAASAAAGYFQGLDHDLAVRAGQPLRHQRFGRQATQAQAGEVVLRGLDARATRGAGAARLVAHRDAGRVVADHPRQRHAWAVADQPVGPFLAVALLGAQADPPFQLAQVGGPGVPLLAFGLLGGEAALLGLALARQSRLLVLAPAFGGRLLLCQPLLFGPLPGLALALRLGLFGDALLLGLGGRLAPGAGLVEAGLGGAGSQG